MALTIKEFEKKHGIHFTTRHTGKMDGMQSLSTSVLENPICMQRSKVKGSICEKCFAIQMNKRLGKDFRDCFKNNTEVLTNTIIPKNEWPILNVAFFRLEAFGDLQNKTQVINYFNLASANKHAVFALWTKNPRFIAEAIEDGYKKPSNMIIIRSSCFINKEDVARYDFIDKVFTVYDKPYIKANGTEINCGARNCLTCRRCYTKKKGVEQIREQLK